VLIAFAVVLDKVLFLLG